jgi:hypothetical protein
MRWRLNYEIPNEDVPKLGDYHLCMGQLPNKLWFYAYLLQNGIGLVAIDFYTEMSKRKDNRIKVLEILDEKGNILQKYLTTNLDASNQVIILFADGDVENFIRWICWYSPNGLLVDYKREFMNKLKPFKSKIDAWLWKKLPSHLVKPY